MKSCWLMIWTSSILFMLFMLGCTAQPPQYHAAPSWLIPEKPEVQTVPASELACLTDDAYSKLVLRDRACWQYARELRALLGPEMDR